MADCTRKCVVERSVEGFRRGDREDKICGLATYRAALHPSEATRRAFER